MRKRRIFRDLGDFQEMLRVVPSTARLALPGIIAMRSLNASDNFT